MSATSSRLERARSEPIELPNRRQHFTSRFVVHASSSWFASFVLHTAAIVALGLIMFPVGEVFSNIRWVVSSPPAPTVVVTDPAEIIPLKAAAPVTQGLLPKAVEIEEEIKPVRADFVAATDSPSAPPRSLPAVENLSRLVPQLSNVEPAPSETKTDKKGQTQPAPQATAPPAPSPEELAQLRAFYDTVVEQFIRYDLGELTGAEGMQAKAAFNSLGPDAVPSLIAGLNRSASINASCPVVVIRSKLRSLLAGTMDPVLIEMAIDNLGKDVPAGAPHANLVNELRFELSNFRDSTLAAEAVSLVRQLSREDRKTVVEALKSDDAKVRWAATRVCAERGFRLLDDLLPMLDDEHPEVQQEARGALVRLARGRDFGPQPNASQEEHDEAVAQWREWAQKFKPAEHDGEDAELAGHLPDDPAPASERRASAYLKMGENLAARGLTEQAQKRYRDLIENFPQTAAADEARRRLEGS